MARTLEEINKEYSDIAMKLGDAYFRHDVELPRNIEALKTKAIDLLNEAKNAKPESSEKTDA